jgi:hypothetical protein
VILWRGALGLNHLTNFTTSQKRFFIFVFGHRHGFRRRRRRRRKRRRNILRHRFRFSFFLRLCVQFSTFSDDYLRLFMGLGEDSELGGGALFATTGHLT